MSLIYLHFYRKCVSVVPFLPLYTRITCRLVIISLFSVVMFSFGKLILIQGMFRKGYAFIIIYLDYIYCLSFVMQAFIRKCYALTDVGHKVRLSVCV